MEKFNTEQYFVSLLVLLVFLFFAHVFKHTLLKSIIIPPALIAGFLALLVGSEGFGVWISEWLKPWIELPAGTIPNWMTIIWKKMPEYWITVVFASLFLGKEIPGMSKVLKESLPNLAYGYTLGIGQYAIGMLLALLVIKPLFDGNVLSGALIAIGFQGGHGTVAGLQSTFSAMGFENGFDLGLGIATIGLLTAIIFGAVRINIVQKDSEDMKMDNIESSPKHDETSLPFQLALLGVTVSIGWFMLSSLQWLETTLVGSKDFRVLKFVPLFPVAMIAGLVIQKIIMGLSLQQHVSRKKINDLSNIALDLLIISAIGSLSLKVLAQNWEILVILAVGGALYNIIIYFIIAPRVFDQSWKTQGLGELGQSMGTTAVGLILLKRAGKDTGNSINAFSYKQPLYEPIVGGGMITALSLPLINQFGAWIFLGIASFITVIFFAGCFFIKKIKTK